MMTMMTMMTVTMGFSLYVTTLWIIYDDDEKYISYTRYLPYKYAGTAVTKPKKKQTNQKKEKGTTREFAASASQGQNNNKIKIHTATEKKKINNINIKQYQHRQKNHSMCFSHFPNK